MAHHMFEGCQPVIPDLPGPSPHGSLVATDDGLIAGFAITNIQERGELFIGSDELLEATPISLRIRKRIADMKLRLRAAQRATEEE